MFTLDDEVVTTEKKDAFIPSTASLPTNLMRPDTNKVVKIVLFTRTEISIYPNGQSYQKTTSWIDKQYVPPSSPKPKIKKATIKIKQNKEEVY